MTVPIFKAEIEAGLAEMIKDSKIVLSSCLNNAESFAGCDLSKFSATAKANDFDLYPLNTILVSVGWNKNTDIFDKQELWAAYQTAEDKPLNIGHNHTKIVGHITSCSPLAEDGKTILASNLSIDELPEKYHILTSAVLYRELKPEAAELKKEIEQIIAEIAKGEWFVSMECLFRGFDYGMIDAGVHKIVPRNQDTAFLTKHLLAYGGSGRYNGKLIGRVLRNITFSGKGLVKNPANPYSIIIAEQFKPSLTTAEIGEDMANEELDKKIETVLAFVKTAADTKVVEAESKVAALTNEVLKIKSETEAKIAEFDSTKAKVAELEAKIVSLEKGKADAEKALAAKEAELAESVKMFNAVRVGKEALEKEKKDEARTKAAKAKISDEKALATFIAKFGDLDDDKFNAILEVIPVVAVTNESAVPAEELNKVVTTAGSAAVAAVTTDKAEASKKLSADLVAFLTKAKKE